MRKWMRESLGASVLGQIAAELRDSTSQDGWERNKRGRAATGAALSATPGGASRAVSRAVGHARTASLMFAIAAACLTLPVALHGFAIDAPTARATLEAMMLLFALAGAWLLRAQFLHTRSLRDLMLLGAVCTIGLLNLCVGALPAALNVHAGSQSAGAEMLGDLGAAVILALAAVAPADRSLIGIRLPVMRAVAVAVGIVAAAEVGGLLLRGPLGVGTTHATQAIDGAARHPLSLLLVLGATAVFASAAVAFQRRTRVEGPTWAPLLAAAAVLLSGASCANLAPHLVAPGRLACADAARFLACALLFVAVARRELRVRSGVARAAALAERRRVASDLHDGLAQDLAFIAAHGAQIADKLGADHPVVTAAKRALAVSRSTISDLTESADASSQEMLESIAHELRARFDVWIMVDAELDRELASDERAHVTRIAREAIANAARHGQAENVLVSLRRLEERVVLRVRDDGTGIVSADGTRAPEGFGLSSMSERAESLGGKLSIRRQATGGTELELVLP